MVKKNMKVGDTFTEGKCTYKITKVLADGNYEALRIATSAQMELPLETVPETTETVEEEKKKEEIPEQAELPFVAVPEKAVEKATKEVKAPKKRATKK